MTPSQQHEDGMAINEQLREEALSWLVRSNDPAFTDWEAFTGWLEQSPAHADAYHELASSERRLTPLLHDLEPAPAKQAKPVRRWAIAASLAVAGLVGVIAGGPALSSDTYETAAGQTRSIRLAAADEMILNGSTKVVVSGWSRRDVRIEQGQALFRLAGKDGLEVRSGDLEIVDIGTVFEVTRDGSTNRIVVADGAVMVDPSAARLTLRAGQQVQARDGATRLMAQAAAADSVGSWQRGQLIFLEAPLSDVAADLSRSTGLAFSTTSAMGARRFSGTLSIAEARRDPAALGPLLGAPVRPAGTGWKIGEGS